MVAEYDRLSDLWSTAYQQQCWEQFDHGPRIRLGHDPHPEVLEPDPVPALEVEKEYEKLVQQQIEELQAPQGPGWSEQTLHPETRGRTEISDLELLDLRDETGAEIHQTPQVHDTSRALMAEWIDVLGDTTEQGGVRGAETPSSPVEVKQTPEEAKRVLLANGKLPPGTTLGRLAWYARSLRDDIKQLFRKKEEDQ